MYIGFGIAEVLEKKQSKKKTSFQYNRIFKYKRRRLAQNNPFVTDLTPLPAATTFVNGVWDLTGKLKKGDENGWRRHRTELKKVYKNHLSSQLSILKLHRHTHNRKRKSRVRPETLIFRRCARFQSNKGIDREKVVTKRKRDAEREDERKIDIFGLKRSQNLLQFHFTADSVFGTVPVPIRALLQVTLPLSLFNRSYLYDSVKSLTGRSVIEDFGP